MNTGPWNEAWLRDSACGIDEPRVWRGVETQHLSATRRLVDAGDEHDALEDMIEASKPPYRVPPHAGQHCLLTTPFRYTPDRPSRFRPAGEPGIWYGARQLRAACAEVAYWRMEFILDSVGLRGRQLTTEHTFFAAHIAGHGLDLTSRPWSNARDYWTNGQDYTETHRLARMAEAAGIQVIEYESVRSRGDTNFAVFTADALAEPAQGVDASQQPWTFTATANRVSCMRTGDRSQRFEWTR